MKFPVITLYGRKSAIENLIDIVMTGNKVSLPFNFFCPVINNWTRFHTKKEEEILKTEFHTGSVGYVQLCARVYTAYAQKTKRFDIEGGKRVQGHSYIFLTG